MTDRYTEVIRACESALVMASHSLIEISDAELAAASEALARAESIGHIIDPTAYRTAMGDGRFKYQGDVLRHLATIEYWFRAGPTRIHKYVDFFLVRYTGGVLVPQQAEVDDARWFPLAEAFALASFDRERDVLVLVLRMAEAGELVNV